MYYVVLYMLPLHLNTGTGLLIFGFGIHKQHTYLNGFWKIITQMHSVFTFTCLIILCQY